jgi:hypothetical protein
LSRVGRQQAVLNQTPRTTETVFDEARAGGHAAGAIELVLNISVDPAIEAIFDAITGDQKGCALAAQGLNLPTTKVVGELVARRAVGSRRWSRERIPM